VSVWRIALAVAAFFLPTATYLLATIAPAWTTRIAGIVVLVGLGTLLAAFTLAATEDD